MDNKIISEILEKGGLISWKDKYFLDFTIEESARPDEGWEGYKIYANLNGNMKVIYISTHIDEILDYFDDIIYTETRNNFINGYRLY